ncbi:hypothetical protein IJG29_02535 [Candidatus Saccharibacteria bacterium]|nr:hypothetical protein [Candidatus Saccharibacteria bacterium]
MSPCVFDWKPKIKRGIYSMKNNLDPVGNLLTNSAIFAFCLMFLVLLITLTGCGANQTGAADAATTTEDTMSVGGHVSLQDTEPLEAESVVPESLSCAEFRERIATIYTGNYHAGGWDGTPVAVTHEDHEHIIELFYSQTIVIDDVIYGDINLPAGASMSMCIKQGQERTYLQGPDRMINAYHAGEMVASYANPQGYYLCMLLQSPADDAKYLIAKEDGYVATSTLAVLNLETGDWQELSTAWADGEYWFSETGKTLFYQNIDGQAYKFDLALAITAPQKSLSVTPVNTGTVASIPTGSLSCALLAPTTSESGLFATSLISGITATHTSAVTAASSASFMATRARKSSGSGLANGPQMTATATS